MRALLLVIFLFFNVLKVSSELDDPSGKPNDVDDSANDILTGMGLHGQKNVGNKNKGAISNSGSIITNKGRDKMPPKEPVVKHSDKLVKVAGAFTTSVPETSTKHMAKTTRSAEVDQSQIPIKDTIKPTSTSSHSRTFVKAESTEKLPRAESQNVGNKLGKSTEHRQQGLSGSTRVSLSRTSKTSSSAINVSPTVSRVSGSFQNKIDKNKTNLKDESHLKGLKTGNHNANKNRNNVPKKTHVDEMPRKQKNNAAKKKNAKCKSGKAQPPREGKSDASKNGLENAKHQMDKNNRQNAVKEFEEQFQGSLDNDQDKEHILVIERKYHDGKSERKSGSFAIIFMSSIVIVIAAYALFHNRQKIIAVLIEGSKKGNNRRPNSKNYSKLQDAMPSIGT